LDTEKRILIGTLALACALSAVSCSGKNDSTSAQNEQSTAAPLVSTVAMADKQTEPQLVKGFYGVENNWRWTAGQFTVVLKTPPKAAQVGATVTFNLTIPAGAAEKNKGISLAASINGMQLKSETYSKTGTYAYTFDVPASMLATDSVKVDFAVDKPLPPGPVDKRELGVVAHSITIASK